MFRAHVGVVTALIANDEVAVDAQLRGIVEDQVQASGGDFSVFAARMAKQVEAGARTTRHILMSLAPRLGLTEAETQEIIAQVYSTGFEDALPE